MPGPSSIPGCDAGHGPILEAMPSWLGVCWHTMKRTTVKLPEDLDAKLRAEADRRGMTVSELTREAIEIASERRSAPRHPRRRLVRTQQDGDLSTRIDEIFGEILDEKRREGEL